MRTTININKDLLIALKSTSERLAISTNDLIAMLFSTVTIKGRLNFTVFEGVRYQDADPEKKWKKFHVTFEPQVYEKALDLKKCFKRSVSFIISFAITHCIDEIEAKLRQDKTNLADNYPLNYIFIRKMYGYIQGYIVIWGIPEEKYLKNLIPY